MWRTASRSRDASANSSERLASVSGVRNYGLRGFLQFEGRDLLLLVCIVITVKGNGDITMIARAPGHFFLVCDNVMYTKCLGSCNVCQWFTDKTASSVKHFVTKLLGQKPYYKQTYGRSTEARNVLTRAQCTPRGEDRTGLRCCVNGEGLRSATVRLRLWRRLGWD